MSLAMSEKVARENGEIIACTRDGIATLFSGTARSCTAKAVFSNCACTRAVLLFHVQTSLPSPPKYGCGQGRSEWTLGVPTNS